MEFAMRRIAITRKIVKEGILDLALASTDYIVTGTEAQQIACYIWIVIYCRPPGRILGGTRVLCEKMHSRECIRW